MTVKLDVPDDKIGAFQRMKRQLPLDIREDLEVQRKMLAYLKLGGDRLVRQFVATIKTDFPEDTLLFKRRSTDEGIDNGNGDGDANQSDTDDPIDADEDDAQDDE